MLSLPVVPVGSALLLPAVPAGSASSLPVVPAAFTLISPVARLPFSQATSMLYGPGSTLPGTRNEPARTSLRVAGASAKRDASRELASPVAPVSPPQALVFTVTVVPGAALAGVISSGPSSSPYADGAAAQRPNAAAARAAAAVPVTRRAGLRMGGSSGQGALAGVSWLRANGRAAAHAC
ncbi:hypothetical protein EES39_03750 [Streptomyces sp. ADI92-24]|nr:hypothetical protein EES39_03750 [Streptomyces sp. ADI92-24]